jgi:hypothetical protein
MAALERALILSWRKEATCNPCSGLPTPVGSDEPFQAKFFVYFHHAQIIFICRDEKRNFWFCEIKQGRSTHCAWVLLLLFRQQQIIKFARWKHPFANDVLFSRVRRTRWRILAYPADGRTSC